MALTQGTFLNSSIQSFNANLGWGESSSTLTVNLADDDGQLFTPGTLGRPIIFDYQNWTFGGILQNWNRKGSSSGNPLYEVRIEDPREVLNGVELILGGYTGTISVTNVLNVYGYLESQGFGSSQRSEAGIPANKVRQAIREIMTGQTSYGGQVNILGNNIYVDISALPVVPSYYRLPYQSMTFLEFIREICDSVNYDFFFELSGQEGAYNLILNVINRNTQPVFGAINTFIANFEGASVKNAGLEFANESTSKYLVGGPKTDIYTQTPNDDETPAAEQSLWQYWGLYKNGNVIIGDGYHNDHAFTIDLRQESIPYFPGPYPTDVEEMRAVLTGEDAWKVFLDMNCYNKYKFDPAGRKTGFFRSGIRPDLKLVRPKGRDVNTGQIKYGPVVVEGSQAYQDWENSKGHEEFLYITYKHSDVPNPHYGKARQMGLDGGITFRYCAAFLYSEAELNNNGNITAHDIQGIRNRLDSEYNIEDDDAQDIHNDVISDLYGLLGQVAGEYYGKKFMVRLPFVQSKRETETNQIYSNYQPTETGFVNEEKFNVAASTNIIPIDFVDPENPENGYQIDPRLMTNDGRFYSYVRFDHGVIRNGRSKIKVRLNYSEVDPEAIIYNENFDSVFVRCEVSPDLVYFDKSTLTDPRAVITLPGRVTYEPDEYADSYYYNLVAKFLYDAVKDKQDVAQAKRDARRVVRDSVGADNLNLWQGKYSVSPQLAAVPLISNVDRYGPWYQSGSNGKTDYEQDDSLVPWNYGSYQNMNAAANAKVNEAISNYQIAENGSITVPDVPSVLLGRALVQSGPYVTNIKCDITTDSVTTTYFMNTWKKNPYKVSKQREDYISRLSLRDKKEAYLLRQQQYNNTRGIQRILEYEYKKFLKDKKKQLSTSHHILAAQRIGDKNVVALMPSYNAYQQFDSDNTYASLDTILVPTTNGGLVESINDVVDGKALDPMPSGVDFSVVTDNNGLTNSTDIRFNHENTKFFGLKMPLMLKGWGYDLNGNPVPGQFRVDDEGEPVKDDEGNNIIDYRDNYTKPSQWVEGPLDVRWDSSRGVWTWPTNTVYTTYKLLIMGNPDDGTFSLEVWCKDKTDDTITNPDDYPTEQKEIEFNWNDNAHEIVGKICQEISILETTDFDYDTNESISNRLPNEQISFRMINGKKEFKFYNSDSTGLTGGAYWTHIVLTQCNEVAET